MVSKDILDVPDRINNLGLQSIKLSKDGVFHLEYGTGGLVKFYPQIFEFIRLFELYPDGYLTLSSDTDRMKLVFDCRNPLLDVGITFFDERELNYKTLEFKKTMEKSIELKDYFSMLMPTIYEIRYWYTSGKSMKIVVHFLIGIELGVFVRPERNVYIGGIQLEDWDNPKEQDIRLLRGVSKYRRGHLALLDRVGPGIPVHYYGISNYRTLKDFSILEKIKNFAESNREIIRDLLKKRIVENV